MSNASQEREFRIKLKAARQGMGFTPDDLADELTACGSETSVDTVNAWENGKDAPKEWERPVVEAAERILGAEGVFTDALGW